MSVLKAADLHAEMDRMVPIAVCISPQFKKSLSECNCKKKKKQGRDGGIRFRLWFLEGQVSGCVWVSSSVVSDSDLWTVDWLLCLWNSPGKNTGVGCHFISFSRGSSQSSDQTRVSCIAGGFLTI